MDQNDAVTPTNASEEASNVSLNDVLTELRTWRRHVNRKEADDDEQLLRTFTDMGEIVTTVQRRTQSYIDRDI